MGIAQTQPTVGWYIVHCWFIIMYIVYTDYHMLACRGFDSNARSLLLTYTFGITAVFLHFKFDIVNKLEEVATCTTIRYPSTSVLFNFCVYFRLN